MCLALPNSYAQGEEVIAWTLMVIHFFVPFWQKALFFWPGKCGVCTPHPNLSLASKCQRRRLLPMKQAAFLLLIAQVSRLASIGKNVLMIFG